MLAYHSTVKRVHDTPHYSLFYCFKDGEKSEFDLRAEKRQIHPSYRKAQISARKNASIVSFYHNSLQTYRKVYIS